jgi:glucose 1-dehydrogenase
MSRFEGKVVIVTGAAAGIGVGVARTFAEEGAAVVIADINAEDGRRVAAVIRKKTKARTLFVKVDVSKASQVQRMIDRTFAALGGVDVLVNNAAVIDMKPVLDYTEAEYDWILDVNLKGPFLASQMVARRWVEAGKQGVIVNVTTIGSERARTNNAPYHASNGGLHSLTQAMAIDLAPYGIRVNAIGPSGVPSNLGGGTPASRLRSLDTIPLGRLATAEEMGRVVMFLASDDAGYITGHQIYFDGGKMAKM